MIVVSAGMPKSGSTWYYNLTNDLLVAAGHQDARAIRQRFHLQPILNHTTGHLIGPRMLKALLLVPHFCGHTFAVKTHSPPGNRFRLPIAAGIAKATYIYRDPRDAALSVFEHGRAVRQKGGTGVFASLESIETAIQFMRKQLAVWEAWTQYEPALLVRYEDLVADTVRELERLVDFLALDVSPEKLCDIAATFRPKNLPNIAQEKGWLHFNKGIVGRHRQVFTPKELELCQEYFGDYLPRMGYEK